MYRVETYTDLESPSSENRAPPSPITEQRIKLKREIMDRESLVLESSREPTPYQSFWQRLTNLFYFGGSIVTDDEEEHQTNTPSIGLSSRVLYLKSGLEVDIPEILEAAEKYKSIDNIHTPTMVYQSGYNLQKVRFFLKVVAELMEAVLFLPEENQDDKFLQGVLSNIVHFFKLDGLHFENERNRYARIITTSELLFENLKMDVLHL